MGDTLQFLVMVDGDLAREALLAAVLRHFPDAVRRKAHSCDLRGNWVEIWPNPDADASRADDGNDPSGAYQYYRWRVEVTPVHAVTEDEQVDLARALIAGFAAAGARPVVCANFENQL